MISICLSCTASRGRRAPGNTTLIKDYARAEFERTVADVCLGKVRVVAAREVSRFVAELSQTTR
jgi:hypothetical protein